MNGEMGKIRRILCIILSLPLLLLVLFSPAFAEETSEPAIEVTVVPIVQETSEPSIEVTVVPIVQETSEPSIEVTVVPIVQETSEPVTDETIAPAVENNEYVASEVLNVILPTNTSFSLDPYEINGRGQIYSDTYEIINLGDTEVVLTLSDIQVTFANDTDFEPLSQPFDESIGSDFKSIYLLLNFGRSNIPPVVVTDPNHKSQVVIPLSGAQSDIADRSLSISFSGNINQDSSVDWCNGDVKIRMIYTLEVVPPPEEEEEPSTPPVEPSVESLPEPSPSPEPSPEPSPSPELEQTLPSATPIPES